MVLPLFPVSPLPADIDRTYSWGESVVTYDSGESQGDSPFLRPLYRYSIPMPVYNEIRQSSLWGFLANDRRGMTRPFLMKDPYDFAVNSVVAVRSGLTTGTLFIYDVNSFRIRPDSTTVASLFSALSGYVLLGTNYTLDQDSGIMTLTTKASADVWSARSMQYFKKVRLMSPFKENAKIWNIFGTTLTINELP